MPQLLLELAICVVCTPPYFDYTFSGEMLKGSYTYSYNAVFFFVMLFRCYLVVRLFSSYSRWTNEKAENVCKKYKTSASTMFAIKCEFKQRPYLMICIGFMFFVCLGALAIRIFEVPYDGPKSSLDLEHYDNGMWLLIITMTTVGYGDGYPVTHGGRFIAIIACIIGMVLVSLMVVSLTNASDFTREETRAYYNIKMTKAGRKLDHKAADVIKNLFRFKSVSQRDFYQTMAGLAIYKRVLYKFVVMKKKAADANVAPPDELLMEVQNRLEFYMENIKKQISKLPSLQVRCLEIKNKQTDLAQRLEDILAVQESLGSHINPVV
jgi:hypothetical protein